MQTISTFVVQYRNLLAKSKNAATPTLADMIITRCPVQDQLWISVVQLNRGRKELVYERIPCAIKNASVGVRIGGATMVFDVRLTGAKDASERLLFRNLQFAGPAPPRRFAVHFQSGSDADEFLYRVQSVLETSELEEAIVEALGPTLEGTDLPAALTSLGKSKSKKKVAVDGAEEASQMQSQSAAPVPAAAQQVAVAPSSSLAESQQLSGNVSQEITFRIDIATAMLPTDTLGAAATVPVVQAQPSETPAPLPEQPKPSPPDPRDLCGVCKLTQFALEKDQGMVFCDKCQRWYHARCAGVPQAHYNAMTDSSPFTCKACVVHTPPPMMPTLPMPKAQPAKFVAAASLVAESQGRAVQVATFAPTPAPAPAVALAAAPPATAPATAKRKVDEALSDGSQQSQVLSGYGAAAAPPPAIVRAPSFRAPLEPPRLPLAPAAASQAPVQTTATQQKHAAVSASASQPPQRAKSPPKSQSFSYSNAAATATRGTVVDPQQSQLAPQPQPQPQSQVQPPVQGGEATTAQREHTEDLGVFQSLLQAMKSGTPAPSAAEQTLKLCIAECLRDPAFPDLVSAVESVWKELEQAGRLPTTQSKCA